MKEKTIEWIRQYIEDKDFPRIKLDKAIEGLSFYAELDNTFENSLNDMDAGIQDQITRIKSFDDIEKFMKSLAEIIKPGYSNTPPQKLYPEDRSQNWMLANLYKEFFGVVDFDFRLGSIKSDTDAEKYIKNPGKANEDRKVYHFLISYLYRNQLSHGTFNYTTTNVFKAITSYLVCTLHLCLDNHARLKELVELKSIKESIDLKKYASEIVKNYETEQNENGYGYIDINWKNYKSTQGSREYTTDDIVETAMSKNVIKLVGNAGAGKSTALRRIEYMLAKHFKKAEMSAIPVYIELYSLVEGDDMFIESIASRLGTDNETVCQTLRLCNVILLLDGYNEILSSDITNTLKQKVAHEMESICRKYPLTRIILTDRTYKSDIPVFQYSDVLNMVDMTMETRKKYFMKNCLPRGAEILCTKADSPEGEDYFRSIDSPLMLKALTSVVNEHIKCGMDDSELLPDDIIPIYIEQLLEREHYEKKDSSIEYLYGCLEFLALMMDLNNETSVSFTAASHWIAKYLAYVGQLVDTRKLITLADHMGLLNVESTGYGQSHSRISFSSVEFMNYFFVSAMECDDFSHIINDCDGV